MTEIGTPKPSSALKKLIWPIVLTAIAATIAHEVFEIIPKKEMGHTRSALGAYRDIVALYRQDKGEYPITFDPLIPKYGRVPFAPDVTYATGWFSYGTHPMGQQIRYVSELQPDDTGGWMYDNNSQSRDFGKIIINCTHMTYAGISYSEM
jgi:hypothetical protein